VDGPNRALGLVLNGIESGRRIGSRGAHKGLERVRSLLLNLLERRQIADYRVETVEGCESGLGRAARGIECALKREDVVLQFVEFRGPDAAELVVGVERVVNQHRLAIGGGD